MGEVSRMEKGKKELESLEEPKSLGDQNIETRERLRAAAEKDEGQEAEETGELQRIRFEEEYHTRFTKELVLKGTDFRESVGVPELGEGAFLVIRPLTDSQFVEVQKTILGDMTVSTLDRPVEKIGGLIDREQQGKYLALSYALSFDGEEWTPEDIGQLPTGVPDKLYERLALISGFPRPPKPELPAEEEEEAPTG